MTFSFYLNTKAISLRRRTGLLICTSQSACCSIAVPVSPERGEPLCCNGFFYSVPVTSEICKVVEYMYKGCGGYRTLPRAVGGGWYGWGCGEPFGFSLEHWNKRKSPSAAAASCDPVNFEVTGTARSGARQKAGDFAAAGGAQ